MDTHPRDNDRKKALYLGILFALVSASSFCHGNSYTAEGVLECQVYAYGNVALESRWNVKLYVQQASWLIFMERTAPAAEHGERYIYTAAFDGTNCSAVTTAFNYPFLKSGHVVAVGGVAAGRQPKWPTVAGSSFLCFVINPQAWSKVHSERKATCIWDDPVMLKHEICLTFKADETMSATTIKRVAAWKNGGKIFYENMRGRLRTKGELPAYERGFTVANYACLLTNTHRAQIPLTAELDVFGPDVARLLDRGDTTLELAYKLYVTNSIPECLLSNFVAQLPGRTFVYDERLLNLVPDADAHYLITNSGPWHPRGPEELLVSLRQRGSLASGGSSGLNSQARHLKRAGVQVWVLALSFLLLSAAWLLQRRR